MTLRLIDKEDHKLEWKIKGKNYKDDTDYYFNFQFSVMFLAITWQNSQKEFMCVLMFKMVIAVPKLGSVLTCGGLLAHLHQIPTLGSAFQTIPSGSQGRSTKT